MILDLLPDKREKGLHDGGHDQYLRDIHKTPSQGEVPDRIKGNKKAKDQYVERLIRIIY